MPYKYILAEQDGTIRGAMTPPQRYLEVSEDAVAHPDSQWVDWETLELRDRAEMEIAYNGELVVGIPCQCKLTVAGPIPHNGETVAAGDLAITFDLPGSYNLLFEPMDPKWLPQNVVVEVYE